MRRLLAGGALLLLGAGAGVLAPRVRAEPHWLELDGTDWRGMGEDERRAWTRGFAAGAATAQALTPATDSLALRQAVDSLRRRGLAFAYAPHVYATRLSDYYFYENHRSLPLWYAMWEVNVELGGRRSGR